jgi:hypothetical protein
MYTDAAYTQTHTHTQLSLTHTQVIYGASGVVVVHDIQANRQHCFAANDGARVAALALHPDNETVKYTYTHTHTHIQNTHTITHSLTHTSRVAA